MKKALSSIFFVVCLTLAAITPSVAAADPVQVLLQGHDLIALEQALTDHGGSVTHRLPIINGIGGTADSSVLDKLLESPAVSRLIEESKPADLPEPRDCHVAGDLDLHIVRDRITWTVHNFGNVDASVDQINIRVPEALGPLTIFVSGTEEDLAPIGELAAGGGELTSKQRLIPGPNLITLAFASIIDRVDQNHIAVELSVDDCSASLPKAYADNHHDFYYPTVIGATLLQEAKLTGNDVTVAVIDSGLWDHPRLTLDANDKPRVIAHYNAINDRDDEPLKDLGGHGSHMASIIAHSGKVTRPNGTGYLGIAPNVRLIPVTAFAPEGDGDFLDIVRGIQWVVDHRENYNIRVLNMSLSATPRFHYWDDPINQAVLKAWKAGIVVVAASGNDGPDWGTVGSPGNNPYVITVGAVTDSWTPEDRSDDYIPDFSSRGPTPTGHIKPDLVAPGGHMTGLIPPDSRLALENPNFILQTGEFVSTGSSQAAAAVTGVVALLLEANPSLTNNDVKCLLNTSAEPAINRDGRLAYSPFEQGAGYVNAARALTLGVTECEQQSMNIDAAVAGRERLYGPAQRLPDGSPSLPGLTSVLATDTTEKGKSDNRRWGAREHLLRLDPDKDSAQAEDVPTDWASAFAEEVEKIESLSQAKPALPQQ